MIHRGQKLYLFFNKDVICFLVSKLWILLCVPVLNELCTNERKEDVRKGEVELRPALQIGFVQEEGCTELRRVHFVKWLGGPVECPLSVQKNSHEAQSICWHE